MRRVATVTLLLLLATAPAAAQGLGARREAAGAVTALGNDAWSKGEYEIAVEHYRSAYRLFPASRLRYNLGLALARLHRDVEAMVELDAFVAAPEDAPAESVKDARAQAAQLGARVGRLEIAGLPGAVVEIDGQPAGALPIDPVRVTPGAHQVAVAKDGYRTFRARLDVAPGAARRATADLQPAAIPVTRRWWFWGLVGVAAAGVITTTALALGAADALPGGELPPVTPQFP